MHAAERSGHFGIDRIYGARITHIEQGFQRLTASPRYIAARTNASTPRG